MMNDKTSRKTAVARDMNVFGCYQKCVKCPWELFALFIFYLIWFFWFVLGRCVLNAAAIGTRVRIKNGKRKFRIDIVALMERQPLDKPRNVARALVAVRKSNKSHFYFRKIIINRLHQIQLSSFFAKWKLRISFSQSRRAIHFFPIRLFVIKVVHSMLFFCFVLFYV